MSTTTSARSEFRAAGTDLSERRRSGVSTGPVVDLAPASDMTGIIWGADGAARIGASVNIATIASDPQLTLGYPGLAAAAGGLATPQVRTLATIGGNLAQRSRCWYFRSPHIDCLRKGGTSCPARDGNHLFHVAFDLGPCIAPHPSTLAAALLAYDATVATNLRTGLSIPQLLGDGSNGRTDNQLDHGEFIKTIQLGTPVAGERALYKRAIGRTYAEWPLVEIVTRAVVSGGNFQTVRIAAGGIAPVPLRLAGAEDAAQGAPANAATAAKAAEQAAVGAKPLPMTAYKLDLLKGLVQDLLGSLAG